MIILGLETSCDETGVAVYDTDRGLIAQELHSQVDLHAVYGGVVPEIASRDHIRCLLPLVQQVLADSGIDKPDAIAYTAGQLAPPPGSLPASDPTALPPTYESDTANRLHL